MPKQLDARDASIIVGYLADAFTHIRQAKDEMKRLGVSGEDTLPALEMLSRETTRIRNLFFPKDFAAVVGDRVTDGTDV